MRCLGSAWNVFLGHEKGPCLTGDFPVPFQYHSDLPTKPAAWISFILYRLGALSVLTDLIPKIAFADEETELPDCSIEFLKFRKKIEKWLPSGVDSSFTDIQTFR